MQLLKEAYVALNPSVEIAIQQTDSSTGIRTLIEGYCDIGMASRALKDKMCIRDRRCKPFSVGISGARSPMSGRA